MRKVMSNDLNLDNLTEKVEDEIEKFLTRVLLKIESDSVRIIDENKANAWGEMRRNVTHTVYREAAKIVGVVGVRSNVPYAIFRHEGTRPHFPPQLAIRQWVIRKGILKMNNKPFSPSKLRRSKKSIADPMMRQISTIAFLIARKISKQGTKGLPFLRMALNQNRSWIESELNKVKFT
jgi:hypothetical protein